MHTSSITRRLFVVCTAILFSLFTPAFADHKNSHAGGVSQVVATTCPSFIAEKITNMLDSGLLGIFGSNLNSSGVNTRNNPMNCKITSTSFVFSIQVFTQPSEFGSFQRSGVNFAANNQTEFFSDHLSSDQAASCAALVGCDKY